MLTQSLVPAAAQDSSALASNPTSSEVVSKLKSWKKRSQRRNMWTVTHVEGTKLSFSKRRSSYRAEDQEAFYRLLGLCSELVEGQVPSTPRIPQALGSWPNLPLGLRAVGCPAGTKADRSVSTVLLWCSCVFI